MNKPLIAPSILSADFTKIAQEVAALESAAADILHCDVMDGVFVPNITFGIKMIADIKRITSLPLDVHLMISSPQNYIDKFIDAGASYLSFHAEACQCIEKTLMAIKSQNVKAGLVIKPDTSVASITEYLPLCDYVLLMSVFPGFGGQKFIEGSLQRLSELALIAKNANKNILVEIDGGVNFENCASIVAAGADILVAGNAIFAHKDKAAAIKKLRGE